MKNVKNSDCFKDSRCDDHGTFRTTDCELATEFIRILILSGYLVTINEPSRLTDEFVITYAFNKEERKMKVLTATAEDMEKNFKKGYVKALLEEGKKPSEIAGRVGLSVSTVRAWMKKFQSEKEKKEVKAVE